MPEVTRFHGHRLTALQAGAFTFEQNTPLLLRVAVRRMGGIGFKPHDGEHGVFTSKDARSHPLGESALDALIFIVKVVNPGWERRVVNHLN
jgi:hypothetical protein